MTDLLLAECVDARGLHAAASAARRRGCRLVDALTPFPVEEVTAMLDADTSKIRPFMLAGGVGVAAVALLTEYATAYLYPYNAGGRPLNSWPAFMLVPFATGILGAAVAGFIRFLIETGLPRLHHPLFAVDGIERATQDRFFLLVAAPPAGDERRAAEAQLRSAGAVAVREV